MFNLIIDNFKCFEHIIVPLNQLTILTGSNGNGKSTVIQALLFLRRTIEHCAEWESNHYNLDNLNALNIELNDSYCLNLGISSNILPVNTKTSDISFQFNYDDNEFFIKYSTNKGDEVHLSILEYTYRKSDVPNPLSYQEFYYLNAERIGPRISQSIKFYDYPNVGLKGEFTAQLIANLNYEFKVDSRRVNVSLIKGHRLEHHVSAWLEFILPGTNITAHKDEKTFTARIEVQNGLSVGNSVIPTNTGFGISYVLPIIVSALIAEENRFLIIENPEAHLHPSAQSKIGYFLAVMASTGLKIIVETHSDHVINGIQIAVAESKINNELISINYFQNVIGGIQPEIKPITISAKGELSDWPKGFFDQTQIDYGHLINLRRR